MDADRLVEQLKPEYLQVKKLPDGSVATLGQLMFTTAIHLKVNEHSWEKRYCFDDHDLALKEFERLTSGDDRPTGWIATRPQEMED